MAPSDYAAFLAWAAAALVVYAGADVANRRGWVGVDYRPKAAVMLLTGLAIQRAAGPRLRAAGPAPLPSSASSSLANALDLRVLLVRRGFLWQHGQSRVPQAVVAESVAGRAPSPRDEASSSVSLLVIAVCVTCLVLTACVAVEVARRRGRMPPPPPPPQTVPKRRYADRRRA